MHGFARRFFFNTIWFLEHWACIGALNFVLGQARFARCIIDTSGIARLAHRSYIENDIYIYIERDRERHIYIYIYRYTYIWQAA